MLALDEPDLHARLSARGLERARLFSWREAGARTLAIYRDLAAAAGAPARRTNSEAVT